MPREQTPEPPRPTSSAACQILLPSLAVALLAAIALAESAGAAETNKFETPTPPGVAIPDTLDTRFGTLHFFGGFPDAASVDKLYDNLDFQRAVQAYLLALPVVSQVANRDNILTAGLANVTVPIWEEMVDAKTTELTATTTRPTPGSGSTCTTARSSSRRRRRSSGWRTTCGTNGLATSASPDPTTAKAASSCSCRPGGRASKSR